MALQEWQFSHSSPAVLMSINIGSLAKSPVWTALLSGVSGVSAADLEKARAAASDLGQVLISVDRGSLQNPSILILTRGNVDTPFGMWLRSGAGLKAVRLDEITTLIGDPNSLQFANLRMRRTMSRTTTNALQQTATREAMKYDAWIGFDPSSLGSLGVGSNATFAALANMRGLSVGLYLRDQIRVEALIDAPSVEIANRMVAAYRQPRGGSQTWVTAEGTQVRYIEITEASRLKDTTVFDAATARMIGSKIAPIIQALAATPRPTEATAAAKPQGAIVIQGLAGGPKVLPSK